MATHIQNLLNNTLGDGARASKFDCDLISSTPQIFPDAREVNTLIKTTSFPGKSHEIIDLKYKGRSVPIKGQVKYGQTWQCTFYLTEDHFLKNSFEMWLEALDQYHNYSRTEMSGVTKAKKQHAYNYTSTIVLKQKNFNNDQDTATYYLQNCFPTEISNVEYSADAIGQIQEFTVTFAYSYYEMHVHKGKDGNFIDEFISKKINELETGATDALNRFGSAAGDLINNLLGGITRSNATSKQTDEQLARGTNKQRRTIQSIKG